ncbi:MAG: M28 family peptidase [Pseudomonadales bacterium]|jgi:hypothetical protein|tara:strand:+ start:142 stop:1554 length:1413 start_codon:yes stop_codon:yes gene_type:complete
MANKASFKRARPAAPNQSVLFNWVKELVELTETFPEFRRFGTAGDAAGRQWIIKTLQGLGIENITEQTYPVTVRHYHQWQLSVGGQEIECFFMNGAEFTDANGVEGELVYIGDKVDSEQDLTGKIVLFDLKSGPAMKGGAFSHVSEYTYDPQGILPESTVGGTGGPAPSNFPSPYYEAARQGAVGFVGIFANRPSNVDTFFADPTGMVQTRIPGLFLKDSSGKALLEQLREQPAGLRGKITLLGEAEESISGNIIVHVPGQKSEAMLVNTHHDAGWSGAVQDASGVAVVMGLAAFYSQFPSNYIQKDLYFVFNGCHYNWNYPFGANQFADMNPEIMQRLVLCFGVEHIGKRFIGVDGKMVDTGEVEPRFIWAPRNKMLFNAAVSAVENNDLHSTAITKPGAIPLYGETQSYFLGGIPCFSIMSMPEYLFFAEDTIDKVAEDQLVPVMTTVLDIMDAAMYMPKTWITHIDK